jgi:hypothetical protein
MGTINKTVCRIGEEAMKAAQINEAVSQAIVSILEQYKSQSLNKTNCTLIYQDIFNTLVELITSSNIELTDEGMNYLSQVYYDNVLINNKHRLNPDIFSKRAKQENIETKELVILCVLLAGTPQGLELARVIKNRG